MQPLASGEKLNAYNRRLQSSHDYELNVHVLNMNEKLVGTVHLIDGQVNMTTTGVRRTASLTLSDPDGALDFSNSASWSGTSLWANRLIRVRHTVEVPGYGPVTATPFIGVPSALSRNGSEVQVELHDKSALATRGGRPYTIRKGTNAVTAIRNIMSYCTGEFRFRLPAKHARRCAVAYSVGLSEAASPWAVASKIARNELGCQLIYSCDGFLTVRRTPSTAVATFSGVTAEANHSVDFSSAINYVSVRGTKVAATRVAAASHSLSPSTLARRGVPRYWPLLVSEAAYKKRNQVAIRANSELSKGLGVYTETGVSVIPMFHLDVDDLVKVWVNGTTVLVRLREVSIPLGVGGDMTIGMRRWVSKPVVIR